MGIFIKYYQLRRDRLFCPPVIIATATWTESDRTQLNQVVQSHVALAEWTCMGEFQTNLHFRRHDVNVMCLELFAGLGPAVTGSHV